MKVFALMIVYTIRKIESLSKEGKVPTSQNYYFSFRHNDFSSINKHIDYVTTNHKFITYRLACINNFLDMDKTYNTC